MALLCLAAYADAQPASSAIPSSAPAAAASTPSGYRSAFDGYRPFADQPVTSWRQSNELVGQIGGWQAYAREGQGGPVAGTAPVASAASGSMAGMPGMGGGMAAMPGMASKPDRQMPNATPGKAAPFAPVSSSPKPTKSPVMTRPATEHRAAQPPHSASAAMSGNTMP